MTSHTPEEIALALAIARSEIAEFAPLLEKSLAYAEKVEAMSDKEVHALLSSNGWNVVADCDTEAKLAILARGEDFKTVEEYRSQVSASPWEYGASLARARGMVERLEAMV
jgi:hypothetical protein